MSDIKILRSFVKYASLDLPSHVFESKEIDMRIKKYNGEIFKYGFSINLKYRFLVDIIVYRSDNIFDISTGSILIDNLAEFLETDDISLIIQYGRCILDDNIINIINRMNTVWGFNVTIDDFKLFTEL